MISKTELKKIARARLKDAQALLAEGRYDGAIYLGGYVIELGLKAKICKTLKWTSYPETNREFQNYQSFKTHDFSVLLSLSGAESKIKSNYLAEWSMVENWNPQMRYNPVGGMMKSDAEAFVVAAGVLLKAL